MHREDAFPKDRANQHQEGEFILLVPSLTLEERPINQNTHSALHHRELRIFPHRLHSEIQQTLRASKVGALLLT